MARVILEMDVHCANCARKIRKAVQNLLGVEKVWATPEQGLVVITGTVDAAVLKRRIQRKLRRNVKIISAGAHLAPPQQQHAPQHGGWGMPHPYGAPHQVYPYAGNYWAPPLPPPRRRHVSHGVPARRHDDEEGPAGCCSIQ